MDIYTKYFLINMVIIFFVAGVDRHVLDDKIENTAFIGAALGWWSLFTIVSVPVWFCYFLWAL